MAISCACLSPSALTPPMDRILSPTAIPSLLSEINTHDNNGLTINTHDDNEFTINTHDDNGLTINTHDNNGKAYNKHP